MVLTMVLAMVFPHAEEECGTSGTLGTCGTWAHKKRIPKRYP